jgi:hypothetical protein
MFEKEIILEEQLAARRLFQFIPARKLPANANQQEGGRSIRQSEYVNQG